MVTFILLNPALDTPISYLWGHDQYEVCVECIRAHECRTCDGETETTFKLCEVHRDIDEETYDVATLDGIRNRIHPLYSSLPGSNEKRKSILKNLKVIPVSAPKPFRRRRILGTPNTTTMAKNNTKVEHDDDDDDDDPLPIPIVTYTHGKGCIFSDSPDVVIKPVDFVKAVDELAKTRHDKLVKILDERVNQTELQPPVTDTDTEAEGGGRAHAGSTSSASSTSGTVTTTSTTVSLSSGLSTCDTVDSNKPNADSSSTGFATSWEDVGNDSDYEHETYYEKREVQKAKEEAEFLALIARLAAEETIQRIRNERARLQECMATSSLAKGLYFKRCNGMFRNALDDELLPLSSISTSTTSSVDTSMVRQGIDSVDINKSDTTSKSATANPLVTDTAKTTTNTMSSTDAGAGVGVNAGECTLSGAGYSLLAHQENICTSPTSSTTDIDDEDVEDDTNTLYAAIERVRANPQTFKFITPVLMSREALVRDGKVESENLEKASWSFNNLQRRARPPPPPPPPSNKYSE